LIVHSLKKTNKLSVDSKELKDEQI